MDDFPWEILLFSFPPIRAWARDWRFWLALWGLEDLLLWARTVFHRWRRWQVRLLPHAALVDLGGPLLLLLL